jgi:superkiller protein 3
MAEPNSFQRLTSKLIANILLVGLACVLLIVTCGGSLFRAVQNNAWSLNFEHFIMGQAVTLQSAPAQHPRAALWLARAALEHNDPVMAQTLVSSLAHGGDKEALAILGDAFSAQGQFSAAVTAWSQAGAIDSLTSAAAMAQSAGRLEDAGLALHAAYSLDPEAGALLLASFNLGSKKDPEGAAAILQTVIQKFPNSIHQVDWCYLLARVFVQEKSYSEADTWFARTIALNPKEPTYWIIRANTARDSGDLVRALDLYTQAAKQFPDDAAVYYEMAWAYKLSGSPVEAVQTIEMAIRLVSPANTGYEVRAGQIYESAGRLDDALIAYRAAQFIDPGVGTSYLMSFYRYSLKNIDGAMAVLRQTIKTYPEVPQHTGWMLQLASFYQNSKLWSEAKTVYQQILAQDPKNFDAFIGLGWTIYFEGDGISAAQIEFQKASDAAPERGEGYLAMGEVLVNKKSYAEADDWFARAIERAPDNSGWWIERGNALRAAGDLNKAIEVYTQATQRFQNFASGYYELAWAYQMNNDKNNSIQAIEKAIALVSTPSEWYYVRAAQIYEWAGLKDQAITAYRGALKINLNNSTAKQGLTKLGQ